jgi:hypothetical protein
MAVLHHQLHKMRISIGNPPQYKEGAAHPRFSNCLHNPLGVSLDKRFLIWPLRRISKRLDFDNVKPILNVE